jgi:hypothetical protein
MKKYFFLFLGIMGLMQYAGAQIDTAKTDFSLGFRTKKYVGFYYLNGFSGDISFKKVMDHKLHFGFNVATSLLGSGLASNAVTATEVEVSVSRFYRVHKRLQPLVRLNAGFANAHYRDEIFDDLPQNDMLLSFESGIAYTFPQKQNRMKILLSGGYNFISGNGITGLGTVYPVYGAFSFFWKL